MNQTGLDHWTARQVSRTLAALLIFFSALGIVTPWQATSGNEKDASKEPPKTARKIAGKILVTLDWKEVPLRSRLMEFGEKYDVPIFLDRRIDPDQKVEFSTRDEPAEGVLSLLAEKLKQGECVLGKVHYIGPKRSAGRLESIAAQRRAELAQLPASSRALWNKSRGLKWDEAAMPRDLAVALVKEAGAALENPDAIPHDIWPAYDLPAMPLTDRLSLVLAGFDLTWHVSEDGSRVRVMPFPEQAAYASSHLLPEDGAAIAAQVQRIFPKLKIERSGNRLNVVATFEEHEKIEELLRTGQTKTVTKGTPTKAFSLTVQNQPAGAVLNTVAKQLGKEFKYDPALREKLSQGVTFSVKDVPLEELLDKTLTPLGLSCKVSEKTLEVVPLP